MPRFRRTLCIGPLLAYLAMLLSPIGSYADGITPPDLYSWSGLVTCWGPGTQINMENATMSSIAAAWVSAANSGAADCHNTPPNANNSYSYHRTDGLTIYFNCDSVTACGGNSVDNSSITVAKTALVNHDNQQSAPQRCSGQGNPIYPALGVKHEVLDVGITLGRLGVVLSYDTSRQVGYSASSPSAVKPVEPSSWFLGNLWSLSLKRELVLQGTSAAAGALLWRGDGRVISMSTQSNGALVGSGDVVGKIVSTSAGYIFSDYSDNSEELYDVAGNLTAIHWADGNVLTFNFTTPATGTFGGLSVLNGVQDAYGRQIAFAYSPGTQLLSGITDANGQTSTLAFNANGMFSGVTWPDTKSKSYVYENTSYPWALTGVIDENGTRFATFGFDANGLAISTEHAGGVNRYAASWTSAPSINITNAVDSASGVTYRSRDWMPPQGLSYSDPSNNQHPIGTTTVLGKTLISSQAQPAGSGCLAAAQTNQYDANGNVTNTTDFNSNRACYAYDSSRNLRTAALEGLPSAKTCPADIAGYTPSTSDATHPERKTTTVWHPDWVLKAREAEPKKITTWVYNGQPDPIGGGTASCVSPTTTLPDGKPLAVVCARYEQATTDATGALGMAASVTGATRKWSYAYNQYGQVLSETTPKQSATDALSHTTTYAYYTDTSLSGNVGHTMGDLHIVTNPKGQQTTYTSYDGAGRLLSSTDANGVVSSQTYWPRGWPHTQTVTPVTGAALTTTYDYWPTGLLKTVTLPDASTLNYTYDDAHRLTDVSDAAGNKIHYVLDNVGNRTGEQVSDASGNLASTVSRVFDALNRVQSQTGLAH